MLAVLSQVLWRPDGGQRAIVDAWPRRFVSARASALGLQAGLADVGHEGGDPADGRDDLLHGAAGLADLG